MFCELREEVDRCGVYNQTLQQEVHALRGQLGVPPDGQPPAAYPVQYAGAWARQTGGRSNDVCPGDDALQVQVEPRDPEGQAIKAPGQLLIQAQEITQGRNQAAAVVLGDSTRTAAPDVEKWPADDRLRPESAVEGLAVHREAARHALSSNSPMAGSSRPTAM